MKLKVSSVSDIGRQRAWNQDTMLVYQDVQREFAFFLVADGMGGHSNGEQASGAISAGMRRWLSQVDLDSFRGSASAALDAVHEQLEEINSFIWETWNQREICGSTCTLLLFLGHGCGVLSVGDSRVYRGRRFHCAPVTRDDVWENQRYVLEHWQGREEKILSHPDYGKLVHAMGIDASFTCSMRTDSLRRGDVFALCSDGVYKMCPPGWLERKIISCRWRNLNRIKDEILREVYRNGAPDNASLILIRYL